MNICSSNTYIEETGTFKVTQIYTSEHTTFFQTINSHK